MTLPILEQAVEAVPDVSFRLRDFLASRVSRPIPEPVQDAPAAEAEVPDAGAAEPGLCPATSPTRHGHGNVCCTLPAEPAHSDHEAGGTGNPPARWPEGGVIDWDAADRAQHGIPRAHLIPDGGYQLPAISVPAKGETAEADAEAGQ